MTVRNFPIFVYGTLRPGGTLYGMAEFHLVRRPELALTSGYALYANKSNTYPYLVKGEPNDIVTGSLLVLPEGEAFERIIQMEMGAGYDVEILDIQTENLGDMRAFGFVLPKQRSQFLGRRIESGDWLEYEERVSKFRREIDAAMGYVEKFPRKAPPSACLRT